MGAVGAAFKVVTTPIKYTGRAIKERYQLAVATGRARNLGSANDTLLKQAVNNTINTANTLTGNVGRGIANTFADEDSKLYDKEEIKKYIKEKHKAGESVKTDELVGVMVHGKYGENILNDYFEEVEDDYGYGG